MPPLLPLAPTLQPIAALCLRIVSLLCALRSVSAAALSWCPVAPVTRLVALQAALTRRWSCGGRKVILASGCRQLTSAATSSGQTAADVPRHATMQSRHTSRVAVPPSDGIKHCSCSPPLPLASSQTPIARAHAHSTSSEPSLASASDAACSLNRWPLLSCSAKSRSTLVHGSAADAAQTLLWLAVVKDGLSSVASQGSALACASLPAHPHLHCPLCECGRL